MNFDGEFNADLTLEIPELENILLVADRELSYINILWVEPQVNGGMLYRPLPSAYDASDDIQYQPVQNLIYYRHFLLFPRGIGYSKKQMKVEPDN